MGSSLDLARLKDDFPILAREVDGKPLVYLDSAATSQKPEVVLDAMDSYYRETNANVRRGVYSLAAEADRRFEVARGSIARLLGGSPDGLVITKNVTEAINLVAWAWGIRTLKPGDEVLVTIMEHHSNIVPWHFLRERKGAVLRWAPITDTGELDLAAFEALLARYTAGPDEIRRFIGEGPILTDDLPLLEFHRSLATDGRPVDVSSLQGDVERHVRK